MITNYKELKAGYYKVLVGLLVLTAVTLVQPYTFMVESTFGIQMLIATAKAWIILMYYMHLQGEKFIGLTVVFSVALVIVFFSIVLTDVKHFQFKDESYITSEKLENNYKISHEH